jgi:peptidoglycan hydrolase-like protein with peptidoglycan-binding domain
MRVLLSVALLWAGVLPVMAQSQAPAPAPAKASTPAETYAAMTLAERAAIQSDLVWTGYYAGIIDGDFGNRSVAAVRAFQKAHKRPETGILNPRERPSSPPRPRHGRSRPAGAGSTTASPASALGFQPSLFRRQAAARTAQAGRPPPATSQSRRSA